jgi:hypothetical protein
MHIQQARQVIVASDATASAKRLTQRGELVQRRGFTESRSSWVIHSSATSSLKRLKSASASPRSHSAATGE